MPGKVAVMDNAGIVSRLIDKSQVAADLSPNALYGAFAINASKGFMGQIYRLVNGAYDRVRFFGAKDWRTRGRSLHDLDKYLESNQPAYAVRAGYIDPNSGLISEHNKLAAIDFYPYPKMSGQYPVNLFNSDGDLLIHSVDSEGNGRYKMPLSLENAASPEVDVSVSTRGDYKATVKLSDMGIFDKKSLTVTKNVDQFLLSDSYTFDKEKIVVDGLIEQERPEVAEVAYRLRGTDVNGNSVTYPRSGTLNYNPVSYLYGDVDKRTWIIKKNEYIMADEDTGFVFLKEQAKPIVEEIREVTYNLTGLNIDDGNEITYPAHGALSYNPSQYLVGDVNSRTWRIHENEYSPKSLNTGLTFVTEQAKPEVKRIDEIEHIEVPLYRLKGVNAAGNMTTYPLTGTLEYNPIPYLFGSPDSHTWVIQKIDNPTEYVDTGLVFLTKREKPELKKFNDVTYRLHGVGSDGGAAVYPIDRTLSYDPKSLLVGDYGTHTWIIKKTDGTDEDTGLIFSVLQEKPNAIAVEEVKNVSVTSYSLKGVNAHGVATSYPLAGSLNYNPEQYLYRGANTHTWIIGANEHTGKDINTRLIASIVQDEPSVIDITEEVVVGYKLEGVGVNGNAITFPRRGILGYNPEEFLVESEEGTWTLVFDADSGEDGDGVPEEDPEDIIEGDNENLGGVNEEDSEEENNEEEPEPEPGDGQQGRNRRRRRLPVFSERPELTTVTETNIIGYRLQGVDENDETAYYPSENNSPLSTNPTGFLIGNVDTLTWKIRRTDDPEEDEETGLVYIKELDSPAVDVTTTINSENVVCYKLEGVNVKGNRAAYPSSGTLPYDPTDYLVEDDNHMWVISANEHTNNVITTGLTAILEQEKPSVKRIKDVTYKLQGIKADGSPADYPIDDSALSYNPVPYLFGSAETQTWVIRENEHSPLSINTGLAFLTEQAMPSIEESSETRPRDVVTYYLTGTNAQGNVVNYPSNGALSYNPNFYLVGNNNTYTWVIKKNKYTMEDIDTGLTYLREHAKPIVNTLEDVTYRLKGVDINGKASSSPVGGVLSYNPEQYLVGDVNTRTWLIEENDYDPNGMNTNLAFLIKQAKPIVEDVVNVEERTSVGYKLKGVTVDGDPAIFPTNSTLTYNPIPYLFGSVDSNSWVIDENSHTNGSTETGLAYLIGVDPAVGKTGLIDDSGNNVDNANSVPGQSKDTVGISPNLLIHGLRKLQKTVNGCEYTLLTKKDLRSIFAKKMPSELAESLAVVVSTQSDHIELGIGESISFDVKGQKETLSLDKDEVGYLQTNNMGYRLIELNPDVFKEPKALATIFAKGEGEWGNNIEVTISQKEFKFIESTGKNAIYAERMDGTGLPILYRNNKSKKNDEKWIKNLNTTDTWKGRDTDETFFGRFAEEDGPRIFSITIKDVSTGVTEFYPSVSFNPQDTDESGNSIYIEKLFSDKSDLVGIVVNEHIEDAGYQPKVNSKNIEILPVNRTSDVQTPYVCSETKRLGGGRDLNVNTMPGTAVAGINTPSALDDYWTETNKSESFKFALNTILEAWLTHDSYLAFNAGQEILNPDFANLIASSNGGLPRVLGLTSVSLGDAMAQDELPADIPEGRGGPSGGVATPWVAKYNQWILGTDSDAGQQIYTSPVGWIGKLIGINAIAGLLPYAPAGYRRGILHGAFGLSRQWAAKQRLGVVEYGWNPIKYDPTAGYVVWDELTSQPIKSALSNMHVILSYQAMRRGIEQTLKGFEFEFNDESTVNTMLNMLRGMADSYVSQKYAEQIIVDAADNTYGTDQIRIRWNVRFKEVARTIVVDVIAYPSSQDISVSMAG